MPSYPYEDRIFTKSEVSHACTGVTEYLDITQTIFVSELQLSINIITTHACCPHESRTQAFFQIGLYRPDKKEAGCGLQLEREWAAGGPDLDNRTQFSSMLATRRVAYVLQN